LFVIWNAIPHSFSTILLSDFHTAPREGTFFVAAWFERVREGRKETNQGRKTKGEKNKDQKNENEHNPAMGRDDFRSHTGYGGWNCRRAREWDPL
jgi:hypothetical protein